MVLRIPLPIWQQMRAYVEASLPDEVTSIGAIKVMSPNLAEVTEIFLPQQEVTSASSKFTKGELGKIISNFVRNNPARAGLFLILLEIIQHVLETCVSVGIHMVMAVFSGQALTKLTLPPGKVIMFLTW